MTGFAQRAISRCDNPTILRRAIEAAQEPHWDGRFSRGGFVYLGESRPQYGWWKIGQTVNPKARTPALAAYGIARLAATIPCEHPRVVEAALHRLFRSVVTPHYRECFYLSADDVAWFCALHPLQGNRIAQYLLDTQRATPGM